MKDPMPWNYFRRRWAFNFLRRSMAEECSRGKNICEFLSLFKTCKLSPRGCWCQSSTQNSLAFIALDVAPEKNYFISFQGWKSRSPGGKTPTVKAACLATSSLVISHKKKGTRLYLMGLLYLSTKATRRTTDTEKQTVVTACRRDVMKQLYVLTTAKHPRHHFFTLSSAAQWCLARTGLLGPATHLLKPKCLLTLLCSPSVVGKKPLPVT